MKAKICGITNLNDALFAIENGADALGFVFYEKSPRYISIEKTKEIIKQLPPFVEKVGLFVNCSTDFINQVAKETKITLAQLHFDVSDNFCKDIDINYIKVLRVKSKQQLEEFRIIDKNSYILVDAFVESYGGEGKRIVLEWFNNIDCSRIILAGGLNSQNIFEVKKYNFYGVDISSGVESSKGIKSHKKILEFMLNLSN